VTVIQSAVPMRIGAAIEEGSGEVVDAAPRLVWLLDLVAELSADLMARCWRPATFGALELLCRATPYVVNAKPFYLS
jgi:hypothetical protein